MLELMYKCNVCNRVKGEGNKWLLVHLSVREGSMRINKWDIALAQSNDMHHICGSECLQKELSVFLAKV